MMGFMTSSPKYCEGDQEEDEMGKVCSIHRRDHFEDACIDGGILEWIIMEEKGMVQIRFIWLRIGASGGIW
jgi:hypothetical protein